MRHVLLRAARASLSHTNILAFGQARGFRAACAHGMVKPFLLADIGEGIREVQIIQWFVQAGARVEQFDKLCEVQSDKASVEITSRFDGVIKKLHYDADDMAQVGKPLIDIDIQSEISPEDEALTTPTGEQAGSPESSQQPQKAAEEATQQPSPETIGKEESGVEADPKPKGKHASLATPAVRHLTKQHDVDIAEIDGTGKDGRVLKEDVHKFVASRSAAHDTPPASAPSSTEVVQPDQKLTLSPTQAAMFKTMSRSLNIPHFLYTDTVDVGPINSLRRSINQAAASSSAEQQLPKLTLLPFLVKALSLAIAKHPILNAHLDNATDTSAPNDKPQLTLRGAHNIGIAVDTPQGLIVPMIKAIQSHSVMSIAAESARLADMARQGKLSANELTGGTFTVSNIGNIGGGVVAPVIVEGQVGIVGIGRSKVVPAFGANGEVVKREEVTLSWSADHRIVDGATVARAAEYVRQLLEEPGRMLVKLR